MLKGIHAVLAQNNAELVKMIDGIRGETIGDEELIFSLSMLLASGRTLEVVTSSPDEARRSRAQIIVPEEDDDDDPENKYSEAKKKREEDRNFFA